MEEKNEWRRRMNGGEEIMMRIFSEMDKHYDRHNEGICSVCGCTMWFRWKLVCNACRDKAIQELIKKEPELKYKVGDWVEVESSHTKGKTFVSVIKEMPNQKHYTVHVNSYFGGYTVYGVMERQIVRKLKPSEVRIRIGCLEGTVEAVSNKGIHLWFHLVRDDGHLIATIRISNLDPHTRSLVESLLKAQKGEK